MSQFLCKRAGASSLLNEHFDFPKARITKGLEREGLFTMGLLFPPLHPDLHWQVHAQPHLAQRWNAAGGKLQPKSRMKIICIFLACTTHTIFL